MKICNRDNQRRVNLVPKLKSTTIHLILRGGQLLSQLRDIIKHSRQRECAIKPNVYQQSPVEFNERTSVMRDFHDVVLERLATNNLLSRIKTAKFCLTKAVVDYIVRCRQIIVGGLVRAASAGVIIGIIVSAGAVVVPTTMVNAQDRYSSPMSDLTKSVVEPALSSESTMVNFEFAPSGTFTESFPLTVSVISANTSATAGEDFVMPASSTMFVGAVTQTFAVEILGDDLDEGDETIVIELEFAAETAATFNIGGMPRQQTARLTINIRDHAGDVEPTVAKNYTGTALEVSKDIGMFDLEFELSAVSGRDVTIDYMVNDPGTNLLPADYTISDTSVTIPKGQTKAKIPITISSAEANETLAINLTLMNTFFTGTQNTELLTITFVDKPSVSIETVTAEVADSDFVESIVKIKPAQTEPITVNITEAGDAPRGGNAVPSITIPANQTQFTHRRMFTGAGSYSVELATTGPDAGKFLLHPSMNSVSANVVDNTGLPETTLGDAPTPSKTENSFNIPVQYTSTATLSDPLPVNYRATDSGIFKGYLDESPVTSSVNIPTGKSTNISVPIDRRSSTLVGDGQITVELLPGPGYKLGTTVSQDVAIPAHNETPPPPVITVTGVTVTEGNTASINFNLDRNAPTDGVTITYEAATFSAAILNTDYTLSPATVSIPSGMREGSITVSATSDGVDEEDTETFVLNLTATGAVFADGGNTTSSISNTINDNDSLPEIAVSSITVRNSDTSFTINLEIESSFRSRYHNCFY